MSNPFIPKDNYISRTTDNIKKDEIKKVIMNQYNRLGVNQKELQLFISDNIDLPTKELIQKAYDEFFNDVNMVIKAIDKKIPQIISDVIRKDSENISKMIKSKEK